MTYKPFSNGVTRAGVGTNAVFFAPFPLASDFFLPKGPIR